MFYIDFQPCRYPISEADSGTFYRIGHITAAVPPGARAITLAVPLENRTVRETRLLVFRKNLRFHPPADNDDDVAFLAVADRAEVIDHPAFEPRDGLEPTKPQWELDKEM